MQKKCSRISLDGIEINENQNVPKLSGGSEGITHYKNGAEVFYECDQDFIFETSRTQILKLLCENGDWLKEDGEKFTRDDIRCEITDECQA